MGTRPKVIARKKKFLDFKNFPPQNGQKLKITSGAEKLCAPTRPFLIFWPVHPNYPPKDILKIRDNGFEYFGEILFSVILPMP